MLQPLHSQGKTPQYPLDRRVGVHQSWSGWRRRRSKEKKFL